MNRNIKSKLSLKGFIIVLFPLILLFCVLGIPKFISSIDEINNNNSNDVTGIVLPILFLLYIIYIFIKLLNKFPELTISQNGIMLKSLFKNETYLWNEIKNIELSGKKQFGTFFNTPIEAVTFELENRKEKYFWIEQYSNSPHIRIILDRAKRILKNDSLNFKNLDFKIETEVIVQEISITEQKEVFNNNYLFSANGILFYGFIIFTLFMIFQNPKTIIQNYDKLFLISLVSLVLCAIFSSTMNFFIVTEKHLIVKNSIWYWKNDVYKIENIKEIIIEMPFRSPITLKIITNNYENKIYKASSLNTSTWQKLILYLENKKVNVRNEVNFS
jgi:hypothetical protein